MQLEEAIRILETLSDGRDPDTGDDLPPESICQRPKVVRALFMALQELKRSAAPAGQAGAGPENSGKPWGAQEEAELLREFKAGLPLPAIATKHGRSVAAIHGRLYLLGKLPAWRPPAKES